jgi:hypothetical protein
VNALSGPEADEALRLLVRALSVVPAAVAGERKIGGEHAAAHPRARLARHRATMRGPMIIATIGPSPNITSGLRSSR